MEIRLGNLTVKQLTSRLDIVLKDQEELELSKMRCDHATDIPHNKFHIFDIPLLIKCGSYDTACRVRDILGVYSNQMKGSIQIGY